MAYNYDNVQPPRIRWTEGITINIGEFEFLRVDLELEDTKRPNETLDEANARIFNYVNDQIEAKVKSARRAFQA